MAKETFYFLEEIYPHVEKALNMRNKSNELQVYITRYIDKNSDVLFHNSPSKRLFYQTKDREIIHKVTGVHPRNVLQTLNKSKVVQSGWKDTFKQPDSWLLLLAIRYYMLNKKEKEMQNTIAYLSLGLYSSIQYKHFRYLPNENIMNYTINNLSNKFYIKKYGILFKAIHETNMGNHDKYSENLERCSDKDLLTYFQALRTRLNSFVQNIATEFYKVKEKGLYLNTQDDSNDEENYYETDNISYQIDRIADKVTNRVLTGNIDEKSLRISAELCGVSSAAIKTALYNIINNKSNEIRKFITLILQIYLVENRNELESISHAKFVRTSLAIYSKSNVSSKQILEMKNILDEWLKDCSERYVKTERAATKSNFRKAIFLYFVFAIQRSYASR